MFTYHMDLISFFLFSFFFDNVWTSFINFVLKVKNQFKACFETVSSLLIFKIKNKTVFLPFFFSSTHTPITIDPFFVRS